MQLVAFSKFSWFPDLHPDDCIDEEEHSDEQDDVRQRLREEKMIATTTTTKTTTSNEEVPTRIGMLFRWETILYFKNAQIILFNCF